MSSQAVAQTAEDKTLISDALAERLDAEAAAMMGSLSQGLDMRGVAMAYMHGCVHLGMAPGKAAQLVELGVRQNAQLCAFTLKSLLDKETPRVIEPDAGDRRFNDEGWRRVPFSILEQWYLLQRNWWDQATRNISGLAAGNEDLVNFYTRLTLDSLSPYNFPWTNPEVVRTTWQTGGRNLLRGARNFARDTYRSKTGKPPRAMEHYTVGENLAVTAGKVVFRNPLIELIQYEPTTARVHPEPILIVPACLMQYYHLSLDEGKSLVRYLLDQGHTVFI